jgi:type IV secretory pathway VirB10-like protein
MSRRVYKRSLDDESSAQAKPDGEGCNAETTTAPIIKRQRDTDGSDIRKKDAATEDAGEDYSDYEEQAGLDNGTSDEQDASEAEDAALERISRQQQQQQLGQEDTSIFEAGVILRVYMENFMCHRLLDLELGKHVNFITGDNGSGECREL